MWLKLLFLLLYVLLLFVVARFLEALAWCEPGWPGLPTCSSYGCRLLDPVLMSVVQLKALLDQRGISYEGVVEKSELTSLISASGEVIVEEAEQSQLEGPTEVETNFTSGAHFIEQVEDAKDSVWLVQVSGHSLQPSDAAHLLSEMRWKSLKRKMAKFGVRMGRLDCSLDEMYCGHKNWHSPFVLLAMPSQHQKKASVAMYNFSSAPAKEKTLLRWVRDKLDERIDRIEDTQSFTHHWQNFGLSNSLNPEIKVVLFTTAETAPLFYSALSVKFPGRVKFGLVTISSLRANNLKWWKILISSQITKLPAYVIYTAEKNYTYGFRPGEHFSFTSMEQFLKFLYPCLNDIFIISFCLANAISWLEPFVSNCSVAKRFKKFTWCVFKYNLMVILLWLPIMAVFQMPYLDRIPLVALKCVRLLSTSSLGEMFRGDYFFYSNHSYLVVVSFIAYVTALTHLCRKYRHQETEEEGDWFNFSQMRTLTHLRPNDFFEPMRIGGYDLLGGLDVFGSRVSQPSLFLPPAVSSGYIQQLPTWTFCPKPLGARALANVESVHAALVSNMSDLSSQAGAMATNETHLNPAYSVDSQASSHSAVTDQSVKSKHDDKAFGPLACNVTTSVSCCSCPSNNPAHGSPHRSHLSRNAGVTKCHYCEKARAQSATSADIVNGKKYNQASSTNLSGPPSSCACEFPSTSHSAQSPGNLYQSPRCSARSALHSASSKGSCQMLLSSNQGTSNHAKNPHDPPARRDQLSPAPSHLTLESSTSESLAAVCQTGPQSGGSGFPVGYLESYQCAICLEEYAPLTSLCGLPCGHVFHETCIISWLNRDHHFCPMCRWPSYRPREHSHNL